MSGRAAALERQPRIVAPLKRGLSRDEAAEYVGVGVTKFDELVDSGQMPAAIRIGTRVLWDIRALDISFDRLSGQPDGSANPWE